MDTNEFKKVVQSHEIPNGFIKVTDKPIGALSSEQKAVLNRKGNMLFNEGKIEEACRIFVTTGYSDGLTRVGDVYSKKNESLTALKFYLLANNARKTEPIFEKLSKIVSVMLTD
ncbi:MAG: hypothetical protein IJP62_07615 [Treponema sp.]|nr:hypothetical protein [Treponema sp.]